MPWGAWYCTDIDWAQKRDSTVAAVVRCDTTPLQLVADACYTEHKHCGEDDLFGSGHPPDTLVALALAYHAFKTGRRPSAETPTRAPAGETR